MPGREVVSYNQDEIETYLTIFDSVTNEMLEGWEKEVEKLTGVGWDLDGGGERSEKL